MSTMQEEIKIEKVAVFVNPFAEVDAQRAEEDRARKEAAATAAAKPQLKELVVRTGTTGLGAVETAAEGVSIHVLSGPPCGGWEVYGPLWRGVRKARA